MLKRLVKGSRSIKTIAQPISWRRYSWHYFLTHGLAIKLSIRNMLLTPFTTFMTILTIGICLSLPISLYLFMKNIQQLTHGWQQGAFLTLYLEPTLAQQEINHLLAEVDSLSFVEKATYLSPEKALTEFQEASGLKEALALLSDNPLPGVISIEFNPDGAPYASLVALKETLAQRKGVKQANFDYEWVEKLQGFLSLGKQLARFLYITIGMGVILMVANTVRLALERHREEIEVLYLVGATQAFIWRPFFYRGILFGALGGLIALGSISLILLFLKPSVTHLISLYEGIFSLENLTIYDTVAFLGASIALGWLGAAIAFSQQYRVLSNDSLSFS